jgi:hypothetical protein
VILTSSELRQIFLSQRWTLAGLAVSDVFLDVLLGWGRAESSLVGEVRVGLAVISSLVVLHAGSSAFLLHVRDAVVGTAVVPLVRCHTRKTLKESVLSAFSAVTQAVWLFSLAHAGEELRSSVLANSALRIYIVGDVAPFLSVWLRYTFSHALRSITGESNQIWCGLTGQIARNNCNKSREQ